MLRQHFFGAPEVVERRVYERASLPTRGHQVSATTPNSFTLAVSMNNCMSYFWSF
jgi:hypothetical protein